MASEIYSGSLRVKNHLNIIILSMGASDLFTVGLRLNIFVTPPPHACEIHNIPTFNYNQLNNILSHLKRVEGF